MNTSPAIMFISEEKVKSYTSIDLNLSSEVLKPQMYNAQEIYLSEILGQSFYQDLQTKYAASSLSTAESYLINYYLGPMLCNYTLYFALPYIKYRIDNTGILSGSSENADEAALKEIQWLQRQALNVAENYTKRTIEYLCNNLSDFSLYQSPDSTKGQLPNKDNPYTSAIVIP